MIAHFIVSTVSGVMVTLCGKYIPPAQVGGARVGKAYADTCPDCKVKVDEAWVSIKGSV